MKKLKVFTICLAIMMLSGNICQAQALEDDLRAYIIADYESGQIIDSYKEDSLVEIASITKLMTYMLVMDRVDNLEERIKIEAEDLKIGGSSLNLREGEDYSIDELINFSLVLSANNATYRLARHIGTTEQGFTRLMNEKAREIGLEEAVFYNSTGLPPKDRQDQNKMSMKDLLLMSRYAIKNYPDLLKRTSLESVYGRDLDDQLKQIKNTNPLLGEIPGVDGLKTGFTNKAGYSYISSYKQRARQDEKELRLLAIIMGTRSEDKRYQLSKSLVEDSLERYGKKEIIGQEGNTVYLEEAKDPRVLVRPLETFTAVVDRTQPLSVVVELEGQPKYPIKKGQRLGSYKVYQGQEEIFSTDALVLKKVKRAGFIRRQFRRIKNKFFS